MEIINLEIKKLAIQLRNAIERAKRKGDFPKNDFINKFPRGCCGDASDMLAQYLMDNGISFKCVCGTYCDQSHEWLEVDNIIVDITSDQFNNNSMFNKSNFPPCYVGCENEFYKLFMQNINYRQSFFGLRGLNGAYYRLNQLYTIIINNI